MTTTARSWMRHGLWLLALTAALGATAAPSLELMNANQTGGVFQLWVKAGQLPAPDGAFALRAGAQSWPVDVVPLGPGQTWCAALIPMKALGTLAVEPAPAAPATPIRVEESAAGLRVFTEAGPVCIGPDGVLTLGEQAAPLALGAPIRNARVTFTGVNVVRVAADGRQFLIWRNGRVRMISSRTETFPRPPGAELFLCTHVLGLRFGQITGLGRWITHDMPRLANILSSPQDWAVFLNTNLAAGVWLRHVSETARDPVQLAAGVITMTPGSGGAALEADLAAVTSEEQGEALYETAMPLLLLQSGRAQLPDENGVRREMRVEDLDANGSDFRSDRFTFLQNGQTTAVLQARAPRLLYYAAAPSNVLRAADLARPAALLEDWNRDGRYFSGPLFWGGWLQQDRCFYGAPKVAGSGELYRDDLEGWLWDAMTRTFDLDGDGDGDVWQTSRGFYFDLDDRPIGCTVFFVPAEGKIGTGWQTWTVHQRGTGVNWGSGGVTRSYKGHYSLEGESQLSFNLDPATRAPEAKLRMTGENWGNWRDMAGLRWNRFVMANLDSLTDEQLGSHYNWDIQFQTGREIQEYNDTGDCFRYGNVFTLSDPWGHKLPLRIWEVPPDWNGKAVQWQYLPEHGVSEPLSHAPWKGIAVHWYPKLLGIFEAEGILGEPADEGMEPWALGYGLARRWEMRLKPKPHGEPITIYYSPLMGGFHFKGAAFSHVNALPSWAGTNIDWSVRSKIREGAIQPYTVPNLLNGDLYGDPYRLRIWGGLFLCAYDEDADDYFDTYLYDETNDGLIDRVLKHTPGANTLELVHAGGLTAWPQAVCFSNNPFLLENRPEIARLYREGNRHEPMISAVILAADGAPVYESNAPPAFAALDAGWLPVAAVDVFHGEPGLYDWKDFSAGGMMRLGGELARRRFRLAIADRPYSAETLAGLSVLVVPRLERLPSAAEQAALADWVRDGGQLLALNATEGSDERFLLDELLRPYGIVFDADVLERRTSIWRQPHYSTNLWRDIRSPTELNRVSHFTANPPALLNAVRYLSFVGAPLLLAGDARPLLSYDGRPLVAETRLGRGAVLACGAGFCLNKYLCYPPFNDGPYVENRLLLERLVARLAGNAPVPRVAAIAQGVRGLRFEITGRGGMARIGRPMENTGLRVNGRELPAGGGRVVAVQLPAGSSVVELAGNIPPPPAAAPPAPAPRYDIPANDKPDWAGDKPYAQRRKGPEATMSMPPELTSVSPYEYPERRDSCRVASRTDMLCVSNDTVEIGCAPDIGGSLLIHRLLRTGENYFGVMTNNLRLRSRVWLDWGGLNDFGFRSFWGPQFFNQPYECRATAGPGWNALVARASADQVDVERTMTLRDGSSALTVRTRQTNRGPHPRLLQAYHHASLQLGRACDAQDLFFGRTPEGGLFRRSYVVGEETWRQVDVRAGWAAATDPVERKAWVKRFDPAATAATGFWPGQSLGNFYADQTMELVEIPRLPFYNAEALSPPRQVAPGAALEFEETFFLIDGLPEVHAVADHMAGYLKPPAALFAADETIPVEIGLGAAEAQARPAGRIRVLQGGRLISETPVDFAPLQAGQGATKIVELPLRGCAEGAARMEFEFVSGGETGRCGEAFVADTPRVRATAAQLAALEKRLATTAMALRRAEAGGADTASARADATLAAVHARAARTDLAAHRHAAAADALALAERWLARAGDKDLR